MMAVFLSVFMLFCVCLGASAITERENAIPGGHFSAELSQQAEMRLPREFSEAGSVGFWVKPLGWHGDSREPHLLLVAGRRGKALSPCVEFYHTQEGRLRLLWILDSSKKQLSELSVKDVFLQDGVWSHLAFAWEKRGENTLLELYANGRKVASTVMEFACPAEHFPLTWRVNEQPAWAAERAKGKTAVGKIIAVPKHLSEGDISRWAQERLLTGRRAVMDSAFVAGSESAVHGVVQTTGAAVLTLEFITEQGDATTQTMPLKVTATGAFDAVFRVPPTCLTVAMTMEDGAGKFIPWKMTAVEYGACLRPICPNYWQAWWIRPPHDPKNGYEGGTWYFATTFEVELSDVASAGFQWVGSNSSQAYINGHDLKRSYRWDSPTAIEDVLPLLKNGRNIIAADARIPHAYGIVMAELTLVMKDGTVRYIASDKDWYGSDTLTAGWNSADFNPTVWEHAKRLQRPPQLPYGETAYRNFAPVPAVELLGGSLELRAHPGETLSLDIAGRCKGRATSSEDVWLLMSLHGTEFARFPMDCSAAGGDVHFRRDVTIPASASSALYDLKLVSRDFAFPETVGTLSIVVESQLTAEVKSVAGTPVLFINGKATPAISQRGSINGRHETSCYRFTSGLDCAGVHLLEVNLRLANVWKPDGSVNTDELDFFLPAALFYAPQSKLIVFFNMDAPEWYKSAHPETLFHSQNGVYNEASYASRKWLEDSNGMLARVIEYIKTRPYYHQIAGFGLDGGEDGQFMQWTGRDRKLVGDYSQNMVVYFHDYLKRKFGAIDKLNAAWHASYKDFDDIAIPSPRRREGTCESMFLEPAKDQDIIEFNRAFSACVADVLSAYAHTVKVLTDRKRLVSMYYGKFFSIAGLLQWGEFDIERILDCPDIDLLIAVDYMQRGAGRPHLVSAPLESYRVHNKIFIDEADIRTFLNGSKAWGAGSNLFDFITCARKMFVLGWVRGAGLHWYDLHGGMFENQGIHDAIGTIQKIAEANPQCRCVPAEVALLVDEKSYLYTTYARREASNTGHQAGHLGKMGTNVDVWFMNDILREDFPKYKMVIVADAWAITAEERQAIDRMKCDGRLMVFLYNAGLIADGTRSAENVARLTGIAMRENLNQNLVMRVQPGEGGIFTLVKDTTYSSRGIVERVAVPADERAVGLGAFVQGGDGRPMAYRDFGTWKSFYAAVPLFSPEMWMSLAKLAGVWLYTEDTDAMVYVGSDLLGVHSGQGGIKKIRFREPKTFADAVTGTVYGTKTAAVEILLAPGETKLIRIK